jgi:hypothetical protein
MKCTQLTLYVFIATVCTTIRSMDRHGRPMMESGEDADADT